MRDNPGGMRSCYPSKRAAANPNLRQRDHWAQHFSVTSRNN